jgi:Fe-S-cluster containining protein
MDAQSQDTVSVEFKVGIADGSFTATAVVPAGPTNLTQILPVLQSLDDSFIHGVTAQISQAGIGVSCKAGCGACCRQIVPLSIFEAEALAGYIRTLPDFQQEELKRRFHESLVRLSEAGLIDRIVTEDWLAGTDSAHQLALDYFKVGVPCPFLEKESCSIHPIRPLICREYLVSSAPQHCSNPAGMLVKPIVLPLYFSRILNAIGAEIENDARGWIPLVFLFAWMESGARPGEAVAGDGPKVLYEFVKRMSTAQTPANTQAASGPPPAEAQLDQPSE